MSEFWPHFVTVMTLVCDISSLGGNPAVNMYSLLSIFSRVVTVLSTAEGFYTSYFVVVVNEIQQSFLSEADLSRISSRRLGLQHRHDPQHPTRLRLVCKPSLQTSKRTILKIRPDCLFCRFSQWIMSLCVCVSAISWEGFSGARVLALPGDVSYAVNHGVYLPDQQVLTLFKLRFFLLSFKL